jgi:hypothetical protein
MNETEIQKFCRRNTESGSDTVRSLNIADLKMDSCDDRWGTVPEFSF